MIRFIKGSIAIKGDNTVVVENGGIGYLVNVPTNSSFYQMNFGDKVEVFTAVIVKEDDISIFGFETLDDVELFNKLITVNGVGAKAAMSIFSAMTCDEIKRAVFMEDVSALTKANGIGKKTAQRIVIDLKDKVGDFAIGNLEEKPSGLDIKGTGNRTMRDDVASALEELGYSRGEAISAVENTYDNNKSLEENIKSALKGGF